MSWQSEPLSALTLKIGSGSTPRGGDSVYISEGTTLIRSQNVYNNEFSTDGLVYIDEKTAEKMKGVSVEKEDVLVNITGDSVARCCLVHDAVLPARVNQHVAILRTNPKKLLPHFLAFYMVSPFMQAKMLSWAGTGGTRKALTKGMLEGFEIPLPPVDVQDKIVQKIKAYNDLIENNRRRIQLLEESARLLYQEWFVHLRFPGHEQAKITDGVPEGWDKTTADNVMDVLSGGTPKTKVPEFWDGEIPFFTPKDAKGLFTYDTEKTITDLGLSKCNSRLYPKYTVFITARGTVGKLSFAQRPMAMNQSCYALIAKGEISQEFLYSSLKASIEQFKARASGAVFDAIVVDTFKNIPFLIPSSSLRDEFTEQVKGVFSQIDNLSIQNMKLAQARDLLLPKLMSGELTV